MKYLGIQFSFGCLLCGLLVGRAAAEPPRRPAIMAKSTDAWTKPYKMLRDQVQSYTAKVERKYFPEFMMIRGSDIIATMQIDPFGAQVLREAASLWYPYRVGLQKCIDRTQNEFRGTQSWSFEKFAWFLDDYVRLVVTSIGEYEEPPMREGMRQKVVTTDRKIYAYTQLATAYLQAKTLRQQGKDSSAERAMGASLRDVGKRVFRLDLTQTFNASDLNGAEWNQPVFRHLAGDVDRAALKLALEPLRALAESKDEPRCEIEMPGRRVARQ